jgi:hypothetical protein
MLVAGASFHHARAATHTAPSLRMSAVTSWYDSGLRLTSETATAVTSTKEWPMRGGANVWHKASGPWPKDAARPWLDESAWPKRWRPAVDFLGRPLEVKLSEEQLAAFGGPEIRQVTYPSLEEEAAMLKGKAAERETTIAETTAEINHLNKLMSQSSKELSAIEEGLALIAAEKAAPTAPAPAQKETPKAAPAKAKASSDAGDKGDSNPAIIAAGLAAAAGAAYYIYSSPAADVAQSAAGLQ